MIFISFVLAVGFLVSNGIWLVNKSDSNDTIRRLMKEVEHKNQILELERNSKHEAVCLCDHGINFHVNGACNVKSLVTHSNYIFGDYNKMVTCSCKRYVGPEPLPEFYALELT